MTDDDTDKKSKRRPLKDRFKLIFEVMKTSTKANLPTDLKPDKFDASTVIGHVEALEYLQDEFFQLFTEGKRIKVTRIRDSFFFEIVKAEEEN